VTTGQEIIQPSLSVADDIEMALEESSGRGCRYARGQFLKLSHPV
jgi:hypothetical protein